MKFRFLLALLLLQTQFQTSNFAQTAYQASRHDLEVSLRNHTLVLLDSSRSLNFESVDSLMAAGKFQKFSDFAARHPGRFASGKFDFWLAFSIENPSADSLELLVVNFFFKSVRIQTANSPVPTFFFERPSWYYLDPLGIVPFKICNKFAYSLPPQTRQNWLVKARYHSMQTDFAPKVNQFDKYYAYRLSNSSWQTTLQTFLCGILITLAVYCFLRYNSLRDPAFFWYGIYCLGMFYVAWRNLEEVLPQLLWSIPVFPWFDSKTFQTVAVVLSYCYFVLHIFNNEPPWLRRFVRAMTYCGLAAVVIEIVLLSLRWSHESWLFYFYFRLAMVMASLVAVFFTARLPGPFTWYVVVGSLGLTILEAVSNFFPARTVEIAQIGIVVELACFSAAMSLRSRMVVEEKNKLELENQQLALEKERSLTEERDRIAAEMHDDLGAGLSTIRFLSMTAERQTLDEKEKQQVAKIGRQAADLMEKMSDIIWAMNSQNDSLENLCYHLRGYAAEFSENNGLDCQISIPEKINPLLLDGRKRRNILLAVKESLNNVVRHSDATAVRFSIQNFEDELKIELQDNGSGQAKTDFARLSGGNGLRNIRQRMEKLGGAADFFQKNGWLVRLSVPLDLTESTIKKVALDR